MRKSFSAQELYVMAYWSKQPKLYGVQDAFANMNPADRKIAMQLVCDQLVLDAVMEMDFDGNYFVSTAYAEIIRFLCECRKCLVIFQQKTADTKEQYVCWEKDDQFLQAEQIGQRYFFSKWDFTCALEKSKGILRSGINLGKQAVIPRVVLNKSKRRCAEGYHDDAVRLLRQNGADKRLAEVIVDGLCGNTHSFTGLLLYADSEENVNRELTFFSAGGTTLSVSKTILNLRTSLLFAEVSKEHAETSIEKLLLDFATTTAKGESV